MTLTSVNIQRPTENAVRKPSVDTTPTEETLPDAGISEVTSSLASMFSQGSPPPADDNIDPGRQQRAPTADMTTALSQQRRLELAEGPIPGLLVNFQQNKQIDHDMSEDSSEETASDEDEIRREGPSVRGTVAQVSPADMNVPDEVEMTDTDVDEGLFVSQTASRASPCESQVVHQQAGPSLPQTESQHLIAMYAADVARLEARRDEEVRTIQPL